MFERLGPLETLTVKRTIIEQKILVEPVTSLPTKSFAPGRHDAKVSFGGQLTKRKRRIKNVELRAQQILPGQLTV